MREYSKLVELLDTIRALDGFDMTSVDAGNLDHAAIDDLKEVLQYFYMLGRQDSENECPPNFDMVFNEYFRK